MSAKDVIVSKNELRFRAFLPSPRDAELSIMRTEGLDEAAVWRLGDQVGEPSGRTAHARGDFTAPDVRRIVNEPWRLRVRPDEPPERHAVIEGWPPATEPEARKSFAQELRAYARPTIRPAPTP